MLGIPEDIDCHGLLVIASRKLHLTHRRFAVESTPSRLTLRLPFRAFVPRFRHYPPADVSRRAREAYLCEIGPSPHDGLNWNSWIMDIVLGSRSSSPLLAATCHMLAYCVAQTGVWSCRAEKRAGGLACPVGEGLAAEAAVGEVAGDPVAF